jgi:hypothetical protein
LLPRALIDLMSLSSSEKLNFDAKQRAELMLKLHEKKSGRNLVKFRPNTEF